MGVGDGNKTRIRTSQGIKQESEQTRENERVDAVIFTQLPDEEFGQIVGIYKLPQRFP